MSRFLSTLLLIPLALLTTLAVPSLWSRSDVSIEQRATIWTFDSKSNGFTVDGFFLVTNHTGKAIDKLSLITNCDCVKYVGLVRTLPPQESCWFRITATRQSIADESIPFDFISSSVPRRIVRWKLSKDHDIIVRATNSGIPNAQSLE